MVSRLSYSSVLGFALEKSMYGLLPVLIKISFRSYFFCKYTDDTLIKDISECSDIMSAQGIPKKIIVSQWCLDYLIQKF